MGQLRVVWHAVESGTSHIVPNVWGQPWVLYRLDQPWVLYRLDHCLRG